MSFPRAAIRRFNEPPDTVTPPPGAYDPKYPDVAVVASSTTKGNGNNEKWSKPNGNLIKSRTESTELNDRFSRESSIARRSTTTMNAPDAGKRDPLVVVNKLYGNVKSRVNSRLSSSSMTKNVNNNRKKSQSSCTASSSSSSCTARKNPEVKVEENEENEEDFQFRQADQSKSNLKPTTNNENDGVVCQGVIHEIQNMAQSLQVEVSEYKRRLASEIIRSKELEAKKIELEFTIKSLIRDVEKGETSKHVWEEANSLHQLKIEELTVKTADLEQQIEVLQAKLSAFQESEDRLTVEVKQLEEDKISLQNEKLKFEMTLEELQGKLVKEELQRLELDQKCKELTAQMDSCYHTCENRTAEIDNMRELFEVREQELTQQKEDLLKELDSVRRELVTQQTLMDLMKNEEKSRQDDYIS